MRRQHNCVNFAKKDMVTRKDFPLAMTLMQEAKKMSVE
jgi:hypothetical protein